jgi:hypothetical protein
MLQKEIAKLEHELVHLVDSHGRRCVRPRGL